MLLFLLLVLLILIAIEAIVGALENMILHKLDEEAKERFLAEKESKYKFMYIYHFYQAKIYIIYYIENNF